MCRTILSIAAFIAVSRLACLASETPRIGAAAAGPQVDVTLKSGESNKGQLLTFANGSLTLKLDTGAVVTQDGSNVVSVRFIAQEKPPTAQETQLATSEIRRLMEYRQNERKSNNGTGPKVQLTKEQEADFKLLCGKLDVHIKALEREIPKAATEEDAHAQLIELMRDYFLYGFQVQAVLSRVKIAVDSIENKAVRDKLDANAMLTKFEENRANASLKSKGPLEKIREKLLEKSAPDKPAAPDKPKPAEQ